MLGWLGLVWDLRNPGEKALTHRLIKPLKSEPLEETAARAGVKTS